MNNPLNPFFLINTASKESYTTPPRQGGEPTFPERNPISHGNRLIGLFNEIINSFNQQVATQKMSSDGFYVDFVGQKNCDLVIKSFENISSKIRLSNVKEIDGEITATVFLPKEKQEYFLNKINKYLESTSGTPTNDKLVRSIENIKLAAIKSFWNGNEENIPNIKKVWCEIWLVNHKNLNKTNIFQELKEISINQNIELDLEKFLEFQERIVILANINRDDILKLINFTTHLSEIKTCPTPVSQFIDMYPSEQREWSDELLSRTTIEESNISICILDTGVNDSHPLLSSHFTFKDTVMPYWRVDDHKGHGTQMAGLSSYGDISNILLSTDHITINHDLSSVKILPRIGTNKKELWGDITTQAVSRKEINNPAKKNIFCMAVTAPTENIEGYKGNPTSWSAAVDNIIYNQEVTDKLFLISTGNVDVYNINYKYFESNNLTEIQEPAQSWNALTIGAYTSKTNVSNEILETLNDVNIIAQNGQISPFTSTSITWDNEWPIKPDVVFEGGNCFSAAGISCDDDPDLSLLSTNWQHGVNQFTYTNATSAATALATNFVAKLYSKFQNARPETIRALTVHSAEWTTEMKQQYSSHPDKKRALLRSCGFGVPNLDKAINCYKNSLTLICEDEIQPYHLEGKDIKTNEMNYYELPWPKEALLELASNDIKMKVTLSYFIEPSPGNIDNFKLDRYRYASHGLRFDINHPDESKNSFLARKNMESRGNDYKSGEYSSSGFWEIGHNLRARGSIVSDTWNGTAAELATCNYICVYPTIGWWKTKTHLKDEKHYNKSVKYSLIVSIYSDDEHTDIYTPVQIAIKHPIEITV